MGFLDTMRAALVHKFIRHIICGKCFLPTCFFYKITSFRSEEKLNQENWFLAGQKYEFSKENIPSLRDVGHEL